MSKPLAIVVDDSLAVREALCSFLAQEEVRAAQAEDGVKGLDLVKRTEPDMAFLDVQLPLLDGLSLLKLTKELRPTLAVVMMSGLATPEDILAAMELGAYSFITKPCNFGVLARVVKEILTKNLPNECRPIRVSVVERKGRRGRRAGAKNEEGGNKMAIVRWSPFRDLVSIQQEVNRLFDDLMTRRGEPSGEGAIWVPAVDISETEDAISVKMEVPGVTKDGIKISVTNNVLTVKGEKKMEKETKEEQYHRVERVYGSFVRSLELPTVVAADQVKATYEDGVLSIVLPKSEEVKPKEIPIETT